VTKCKPDPAFFSSCGGPDHPGPGARVVFEDASPASRPPGLASYIVGVATTHSADALVVQVDRVVERLMTRVDCLLALILTRRDKNPTEVWPQSASDSLFRSAYPGFFFMLLIQTN